MKCPICGVVAVGSSDVWALFLRASSIHLPELVGLRVCRTGLEDWLQAEEDRADAEEDSFNASDLRTLA